MGSPNGGIIGVVNPTSFGKCTVTSVTSSTPAFTTQPGTRLVSALVVAVEEVEEQDQEVEEVELEV
jgi:hypothetical protein